MFFSVARTPLNGDRIRGRDASELGRGGGLVIALAGGGRGARSCAQEIRRGLRERRVGRARGRASPRPSGRARACAPPRPAARRNSGRTRAPGRDGARTACPTARRTRRAAVVSRRAATARTPPVRHRAPDPARAARGAARARFHGSSREIRARTSGSRPRRLAARPSQQRPSRARRGASSAP